MSLRIRDAAAGDVPALHAIYAHHALHGLGTFDEVPPPLSAFEEKWHGIMACGLPWLVAQGDGEVLEPIREVVESKESVVIH